MEEKRDRRKTAGRVSLGLIQHDGLGLLWHKSSVDAAHAKEWTARRHAVDVCDAATSLSLQKLRAQTPMRTLKVRATEGDAAQEHSAHLVEKHGR